MNWLTKHGVLISISPRVQITLRGIRTELDLIFLKHMSVDVNVYWWPEGKLYCYHTSDRCMELGGLKLIFIEFGWCLHKR